jgi:hypothetical protein
VCFAITFEVEDEVATLSAVRGCEPYDAAQPLFTAVPPLLGHARKGELIDASVLEFDGGVARYGTAYGQVQRWLNPAIISWTLEQFPGKPLWIRLDPHLVSTARPLQPLFDSAWVPADPRWWRKLEHRGHRGGSTFVVRPDVQPNGPNGREYWDYHVTKIRRLEVSYGSSAKASKPHAQSTVEELQELPGRGVVGRCIHLDWVPDGGSPEHTALLHLDLAMQFYWGDRGAVRLAHELRNGQVVDANVRTHVLRVEGVPASAMTAYAWMFFRSKALVEEWAREHFGPPVAR